MTPHPLTPFLPTHINTGPWLAGYSLNELKSRIGTERMVLPICSLGTPPEQLAELAPLVLPPLYHEALDAELKSALQRQVPRCFPFYEGTRNRADFRGSFEIVELPARRHAPPVRRSKILAFSVDTAVEQHGPHLPLATDTIQSYAVLHELAAQTDGLVVGPPVDYGHLTWGLPFGLSIDLTPPLVTRYVCGFVNAVVDWMSPESLYVADVHGSLVHRNAIQDGLRRSRCARWAFRWLYEPLVEFSSARGDMHAGGVETALVEHISRDLVDSHWWPGRRDELAVGQMTMAHAVELSADLRRFIDQVESHPFNGIVGHVGNYFDLDAGDLMNRMLEVARQDVHGLLC
ncbi:MAG: creatininase family protein [Verrucomicrobia bacterium]|nr:creatininase family protein [Verrucomicrobiota bacterium]